MKPQEKRHMFQSHRSISLAVSIGLLGVTPSLGEQPCKPRLSVEDARLSDAQHLRRTWTATLRADASRCAGASGEMHIRFTRLKENAPDLIFSQPFTWTRERTDISLEFWADEAVLDYSIGSIVPCRCGG
jgi:hypothetical protein